MRQLVEFLCRITASVGSLFRCRSRSLGNRRWLVSEAPRDGQGYARQSGDWTDAPLFGEINLSDGTYSWKMRADEAAGGWLEIIGDFGAGTYGLYIYETADVGVYDAYVASPSEPPEAGDGDFGAVFTLWSQNDYEIGGWGFYGDDGNMDFFNGILGCNLSIGVYNDAGTFRSFTLRPDELELDSEFSLITARSVFIGEQATDLADKSNHGQLWVRSSDNALMYTSEGGTQYTVDLTAV